MWAEMACPGDWQLGAPPRRRIGRGFLGGSIRRLCGYSRIVLAVCCERMHVPVPRAPVCCRPDRLAACPDPSTVSATLPLALPHSRRAQLASAAPALGSRPTASPRRLSPWALASKSLNQARCPAPNEPPLPTRPSSAVAEDGSWSHQNVCRYRLALARMH